VTATALRQSVVTAATRASSRASAPNALTVGLEAMESARDPPMRESMATERLLAFWM